MKTNMPRSAPEHGAAPDGSDMERESARERDREGERDSVREKERKRK